MRGQNNAPLKQSRRRDRLLAAAFTAALYGVVLGALFWPRAAPPPQPPEPPPLRLSLMEVPRPPAPPAQGEARAPSISARPTMPSPVPPTVAIARPDTSDLLSDSEIAGAASAEGGGGGGGCDLARAVQQALRRDPLVRTALEDADRLGKSVMLWNGDWVRSGAQEGKGLSAVREAIVWELAFAPSACRNQRVHGLVLLSLADGATRFAIGSSDWRWSDLLH